MDQERRKTLIELYRKSSDDDLEQLLLEGKESYEDGAYDLIVAEAKRRHIHTGPDYIEAYDEDEAEDGEAVKEIRFDMISDPDLMGVLVNIHQLDELNFHLASAEAIRRRIDETYIRAYRKTVQRESCAEPVDVEMIENPRPLIIVKTIDEAGFYAEALEGEGIPYEVQIIVDDRDYKQAEMATNGIMPPENDE
ncbi:MAG: hypothetical protein QUS12_05895 [Methanosarcina sp.]|nr:hypothetical protein [Methanosarcina sp.]